AATPGVTVQQIATDPTYYAPRGSEISMFQIDVLAIPLPCGIQNGDIDTAIYGRIEVLRGANGLLSSTGNPSATINFTRKRPTAVFQGSAGLTVGRWDLRRIDVDLSGTGNTAGSVRG